MKYEVVIGLEVHSQLLTRSKMFCSCEANYQRATPNSLVCEICMGMPGVLPVINRRAVELVIATGLSLGCSIAKTTKFDRKNYLYPDLMKGYQISQYDMPIASSGELNFRVDGNPKRVGITRVHLEEDVAKLIHRSGGLDGDNHSLLDINRAGVSLMETVSEPDMRSPEEAIAYLSTLHSILRYIGASTAKMEEGSFRCDANISLRPFGTKCFGTKVEIKNMNSFRAVYSALEYETKRQMTTLESGMTISQETRGWVDDKGITVSQRTKEYASDYRYFPEPDLLPIVIGDDWIEQVKTNLPELPQARKNRIASAYMLSEYDAELLTESKSTADFFEEVMGIEGSIGEVPQRAKIVSNWMVGELAKLLKENMSDIEDVKITPEYFADLINLVESGTLSNNMAKDLLEKMFKTGQSPRDLADEFDMVQLSDDILLLPAVKEAIAENTQAVDDYLSGKDSAVRFLIGQVMRITRGKANPQIAERLVKQQLESMR